MRCVNENEVMITLGIPNVTSDGVEYCDELTFIADRERLFSKSQYDFYDYAYGLSKGWIKLHPRVNESNDKIRSEIWPIVTEDIPD
jgi:hypothetical protein